MRLRAIQTLMAAAGLLLAAALLPRPAGSQVANAQRDPVVTRVLARSPEVPPLVLALYYPWYGLPEVSGAYRHVDGLDLGKKQVASFTHYPAGGPYDSTDPNAVTSHLRQLRQAGVDAIACSWWGPGDFTDKALRKLLPLARREGLKVCLYLETVPTAAGDPLTAARELGALISGMAEDAAYLKVANKPVVFLYSRARDQLGGELWADTLVRLQETNSPGILAIVEGNGLVESLVFDGLHLNNPVYLLGAPETGITLARHAAVSRSLVGLARRRNRIAVATVTPGFDDTRTNKPGLKLEREGGQFYRNSWEGATAALPDWVLVRSFNQWHDGTEIEPSVENGDLYLKITEEYARRFKQAATRSPKK